MRGKTPLLVTLLLATSTAFAQTTINLPESVVTATREPTPVTNIPAGVTVIDREAIRSSGAVTLGDVLTIVPGLHVSPTGGPGGQSSVFMRGTSAGHVLVLRDGMPVNDASDATGAFNFGIVTLSDIERIEIVRGPMAALYGSGAIGGVINLISRRGAEGAPRLEMDLSGGYPASIVGAASASGVMGPMDYALTLESQSRRGFDTTPQRFSTYTSTPQGFRDRIATVNLGYTPVEGTRLSLFLRGAETNFGITDGPGALDAANFEGTTTSLLGRIGVTSHLFDGVYETNLFLGHGQDDRRYVQNFNSADPNASTGDNRYHAYRTDLQWNNIVHLNNVFPSGLFSKSDLSIGLQRTEDTIHIRTNDVFFNPYYPPFAEAASNRAGMRDSAIYAGFTTTLFQRLILTGQMRQDWVGPNSPTTWRLGSVLRVPEILTSFKAAYGTSFRAASLYQRFGADAFNVGNPSLKPESAEGWELGFTSTIPALGRPDAVVAGVTYFNQHIRDFIVGDVFLPNGLSTYENVDYAHIEGAEFEVTLHPAAFLSLRASYTYTNVTSNNVDAVLRRPKNAFEVNATIMPVPGLRIVPVLVYTGSALDILYDNSGNFLGQGVGQHGLIANLTTSYDLTPQVQLHLDATNLFNSRFEPVNGYQMPGTTILAGVRLHM